jgi:hypothetical protein
MKNNDIPGIQYKRQYAEIPDDPKPVPGKRTGREIIPNGNELFGNDLQDIINAHRNENLVALYESSSSSSSSKLSITSSDISESIDDEDDEEVGKQTEEITKKSIIPAVVKEDGIGGSNASAKSDAKKIEEDMKKAVFKETPVKTVINTIKEEKKESSSELSSSEDEQESNDFFTEVKRQPDVVYKFII